jgi:TRAP-type mannitol/chloroaromatic compound transport system permease small subunit
MQVGALDAVLKTLLPVTRVVDAVTTWIGKRLSWLILAAVVVSAANATVRKIFDTSSNSWLELQWVLFSIVFLLCSPWTLLENEHIRIDIVNNMLPKRLRDSIDAVGHAFFLLPLTIILVITGIPFFLRSVEINEQSGNAGGLPQWPSKALIMIAFAMLLIQGLSELIKRIAVMRNLIPDPHATQVHALEAEVEHIVEAIKKS